MKIHLINLDRSPDRLARMKRQFGVLGLQFERIPAVDGSTLPPHELARHNKSTAHRPLSAGEVGCFLSHRAVWLRISEQKEDMAIVTEDDILVDELTRQFANSTDWVPRDADIVKLETSGRTTTLGKHLSPLDNKFSIAQLLGLHVGTGAYVITLRAAKYLLRTTETFNAPVDQLLFNPESAVCESLQIYQLIPALCIQEQFREHRTNADFLDSGITRGKTQRLSIMFRLRRELIRIYRQVQIAISGHRINILSHRINKKVPFSGDIP